MLHDPTPTSYRDFVPVLRWQGYRPSLGELQTWYEAMSGMASAIVPGDLFAAWLLPEIGTPVLLGPPELSADELALPQPTPLVPQESLFGLEDRIHAAGFRSVMAVAVREGTRDAGLLVVGSLAADRYDREALRALHRLADAVAPTCARLASRPWLAPIRAGADDEATEGRVLRGLLDVVSRGRNAADLVHLTSDLLSELLPHDAVEIIVPVRSPPAWTLLGQIEGPAPVDPGVVALRRTEALVQHFGGAASVRVEDLGRLGLAWPSGPARAGWGGVDGLLAARLDVAGECLGWLCFGSERTAWFRPEDEALAVLAARALAARVGMWVARSHQRTEN